MFRPPPSSTLFPYTTLFRSDEAARAGDETSTSPALGASIGSLHDPGLPSVQVLPATGRPTANTVSPRSCVGPVAKDRKSTRLNSSHVSISYAVFCLKKKKHY